MFKIKLAIAEPTATLKGTGLFARKSSKEELQLLRDARKLLKDNAKQPDLPVCEVLSSLRGADAKQLFVSLLKGDLLTVSKEANLDAFEDLLMSDVAFTSKRFSSQIRTVHFAPVAVGVSRWRSTGWVYNLASSDSEMCGLPAPEHFGFIPFDDIYYGDFFNHEYVKESLACKILSVVIERKEWELKAERLKEMGKKKAGAKFYDDFDPKGKDLIFITSSEMDDYRHAVRNMPEGDLLEVTNVSVGFAWHNQFEHLILNKNHSCKLQFSFDDSRHEKCKSVPECGEITDLLVPFDDATNSVTLRQKIDDLSYADIRGSVFAVCLTHRRALAEIFMRHVMNERNGEGFKVMVLHRDMYDAFCRLRSLDPSLPAPAEVMIVDDVCSMHAVSNDDGTMTVYQNANLVDDGEIMCDGLHIKTGRISISLFNLQHSPVVSYAKACDSEQGLERIRERLNRMSEEQLAVIKGCPAVVSALKDPAGE